jgi:hypothetical protein
VVWGSFVTVPCGILHRHAVLTWSLVRSERTQSHRRQAYAAASTDLGNLGRDIERFGVYAEAIDCGT